MKFKQWNIHRAEETQVRTLMAAGCSYLLSSVLAPRGISTQEEVRQLTLRRDRLTLDPMSMKDMDAAVARIRRALDTGEKLAVFGDYDVDGITSTCLVTDALRRAGADCEKYIPHRIEDGYGLNNDALRRLKEHGVSLVITVDCGITGVEEAAYAREIGLDLVITDHHECKAELPAAAAVVNPHRSDCTYPFKDLAGVGVALNLIMALFGPEHYDEVFRRYCPLAAIGTVADVMSMTGENRTIVQCGLALLKQSECVGLHALLRETGLEEKEISSTNIGFVLAPRINAAGRMGQADTAAELFLTQDSVQAERLAKELCALNRERQQVEQQIFAEAEERIAVLPAEERNALVLESDTWHQGVVGIVASRLSEKYACPSFMIRLNGDVGKGSCRSYGGFNLFAALEQCQDLLLGFGGHELAAGFTIERAQIPAFRARMNACVRSYFGAGMPASCLEINALITHPNLLTLSEVEGLSALEPYGADNPRPLFCIQGLTADCLQNVGQNKHLKLRFSKGAMQFDGIFFSMNSETCGISRGDRVDAAFYLNVNEFRGRCTVQMQLVDLRQSLEPSVREREDLEKVRRFLNGEGVTPQEAVHMLPERAQFADCWRFLDSVLPRQGAWETPCLPMLRQIEKHMSGMDPFLRSMLCLAVFCERGLLQIDGEGDERRVQRLPISGKADLSASVYVKTLQMMIQTRR